MTDDYDRLMIPDADIGVGLIDAQVEVVIWDREHDHQVLLFLSPESAEAFAAALSKFSQRARGRKWQDDIARRTNGTTA